ncbi:MAG: hypothetical protein KKE04_03320 [Candidatus Thermoplasmatota archaeon]|nr:hypothetical protein [Candidatus Thermoplasmatota archaeon]
MKNKTIFIGKGDMATLAAICYAGLGAFIFFSIWFGNGSKPWPTVGEGDVGVRTWFTAVIIMCAAISALAVMAKLHGTFQRDVRTSFTFGVFIILIASIIIALSAQGDPEMGFYVFISSVVSGLGTYLFIYSAKVER